MAGKFQIFVDDFGEGVGDQAAGLAAKELNNHLQHQPPPPPKDLAVLQPSSKREPLGLRQALTSQASQMSIDHQQQQLSSSQQQHSNHNTSSSTSSLDDQENDISMASLGSDFVPSIIHDEVNDLDLTGLSEGDGLGTTILSNQCDEEEIDDNHHEGQFSSSENMLEFDESELMIEDEEEADARYDEELKLELSQAFKQHDDSQLFKSTIYIDDINQYLTKLERKAELRALPNYMDFQNHIDSEKRSILINWLVEVSDEYQLQSETLFICIAIIDRFLSKMSIPTVNLQLLGVSAMFIASKYEEIYPPSLFQFVEVTDETYTGQQICQMEQEILKTLNFRISTPTTSFFLRQIFAFNKFSRKVYHLAEYLCYLSLINDQPFLEYYPSEIALASVILAAYQLNAQANISAQLRDAFDRSILEQLERRTLPKNEELAKIDRRVYTLNQDLPFCIEALRLIQDKAHSGSSRHPTDSAIYNRFADEAHNCVSLLPAVGVEVLGAIVE